MIYQIDETQIELTVPTRADAARWMGMCAQWSVIDDPADQMAARYAAADRWLLALGATRERLDELSVATVMRLADQVYTDAMPTGTTLGKSAITRLS